MVRSRGIEGLVPTIANVGLGRCKEAVRSLAAAHRFDDGLDLADVVALGQPVDLGNVEDRVGLQERNVTVDLFAARAKLGLGEAAGKDDGRTLDRKSVV